MAFPCQLWREERQLSYMEWWKHIMLFLIQLKIRQLQDITGKCGTSDIQKLSLIHRLEQQPSKWRSFLPLHIRKSVCKHNLHGTWKRVVNKSVLYCEFANWTKPTGDEVEEKREELREQDGVGVGELIPELAQIAHLWWNGCSELGWV